MKMNNLKTPLSKHWPEISYFNTIQEYPVLYECWQVKEWVTRFLGESFYVSLKLQCPVDFATRDYYIGPTHIIRLEVWKKNEPQNSGLVIEEFVDGSERIQKAAIETISDFVKFFVTENYFKDCTPFTNA